MQWGFSVFCGVAVWIAGGLPVAVAAPGPASLVKEQEEIPDWKARWELARTLGYVQRLDEAVTEYRKLIAERPDLLQAQAELAVILTWQGKGDEAFELIRKVPEESLDEKGRLALADLHLARANYDKAEPLLRAHLAQQPDDPVTRYKLAEMLSWGKRYEEALKEYRLILAARPDDVQVRRKYAQLLGWTGRHAEAVEELRRTLDVKP